MSGEPASKFPVDAAAPEVGAVARIAEIESILEVCARVTGMGYCVVAHVSEERWLACAVLDDIGFGLPAGGELPINSTLCREVLRNRATIAFDQASADPRWRDHPTPRTYGLESYIAAPIILADGRFFGTLCAIDPKAAPASRGDIVRMFELFARLIANHLDAQDRIAVSEAALLDAQQTAEFREQFIAVLGHDLRNPLAALDAGVSLLRRRITGNPAATQILGEMGRSSARMARLISDVLDFARGRLGGGLRIARRASAELSEMLEEVVAEIEAVHPGRNIRTEIAPGLDVQCDPDRIAQLMSNLLANAVSHGDPAKPVVVAARTGGGTFELYVANGGKPIPRDVLPRLFQPFNRAQTSEVRDGLGLGLYISSQIAKAHGGQLMVCSDEAETRFVLRMPARAEAAPSGAGPAEWERPPGGSGS